MLSEREKLEEELRFLEESFKIGVITEEEFESGKQRIESKLKESDGEKDVADDIIEEAKKEPEEIKHAEEEVKKEESQLKLGEKEPNKQDKDLLEEWDIESKSLQVNIFTPTGYFKKYKDEGIPTDYPFSIKTCSNLHPIPLSLQVSLSLSVKFLLC